MILRTHRSQLWTRWILSILSMLRKVLETMPMLPDHHPLLATSEEHPTRTLMQASRPQNSSYSDSTLRLYCRSFGSPESDSRASHLLSAVDCHCHHNSSWVCDSDVLGNTVPLFPRQFAAGVTVVEWVFASIGLSPPKITLICTT